MNKCVIIGNLSRDPDVRKTKAGLSVCSFTVGVKRNSADRKTDWIPVTAWRGLADNCGKYLAKGSQVAVIGSIQTRSYDTKSGEKRNVTEILADEIQFLSKKPAANTGDDIFGDTDEGFTPVDDFGGDDPF